MIIHRYNNHFNDNIQQHTTNSGPFIYFLPYSGESRHTITEGEAVDERQAIKPVVVLRVTHREESRAIPQEGALQPGWDGAYGAKSASLTLG